MHGPSMMGDGGAAGAMPSMMTLSLLGDAGHATSLLAPSALDGRSAEDRGGMRRKQPLLKPSPYVFPQVLQDNGSGLSPVHRPPTAADGSRGRPDTRGSPPPRGHTAHSMSPARSLSPSLPSPVHADNNRRSLPGTPMAGRGGGRGRRDGGGGGGARSDSRARSRGRGDRGRSRDGGGQAGAVAVAVAAPRPPDMMHWPPPLMGAELSRMGSSVLPNPGASLFQGSMATEVPSEVLPSLYGSPSNQRYGGMGPGPLVAGESSLLSPTGYVPPSSPIGDRPQQ